MNKYSLSHTRWKCQYHIVFIPKYRQKVLYGKLRKDIREIIKKLCMYRSYTFMCKYTTQRKCIKFYGVLKGKKCVNDI